MADITDYGAFCAAIVLFLALPGPGTFALLTSTGKGGFRAGAAAMAVAVALEDGLAGVRAAWARRAGWCAVGLLAIFAAAGVVAAVVFLAFPQRLAAIPAALRDGIGLMWFLPPAAAE